MPKLNDLKDHLSQYVWNVTLDVLYSSIEHIVHRFDYVLQHNGHVDPKLDFQRQAKHLPHSL